IVFDPMFVFNEPYCSRAAPLPQCSLGASGDVHRLSFTHPFLTLAREHLERIPTRVLARAQQVLNAGSVHNLISEPNKMIDHPANLVQIVVPGELSAKESDLIFI